MLVKTYNSLYHICPALSHVASEGIHVNLALGVGLIKQRV